MQVPFLYLGNQRSDFHEIYYIARHSANIVSAQLKEARYSTSIAGAHLKVDLQVHVHTCTPLVACCVTKLITKQSTFLVLYFVI